MKKKRITLGFLSQGGEPTQHALMMFFVYLSNLPKDWNHEIINQDAVTKVREYFNWVHENGFDIMIKWGIDINCGKSKSSDRRHRAMSLAYHDALGLIGKNYVYTTKTVD